MNRLMMDGKTMEMTRKFLSEIGLPTGDLYSLPRSEKRFPDGGVYRFEVQGIQGPAASSAITKFLR